MDFKNGTTKEIEKLASHVTNFTGSQKIGETLKLKLKLMDDDKLLFLHGSKFERKFKRGFDKRDTKSGIFLNYGNMRKKVMFMKSVRRVNYTHNNMCSVIELKLDNNDRLLIFLPNERKNYKDLISHLNYVKMNEIMESMKERMVDIRIPKFSLICEKTSESLRSHEDMYHLATTASMSDMSDGYGFHLSSVMSTISFQIDEEGIKVYSITTSTGRSKSVTFNCNHPFIFFVLSAKDNLCLLLGVIENL
ncbi:Serpin B8-like protein [Leptotrombidium deliense]|uniref:Serpin B8-like protein n=1 Tax=Leptotrombidium deliense TaxID=299467 RepID=A0A443RWH7_9ACAR|nr:Serpin B8-like protein [Leptotrombidium deliense]